MTRSAKVVYFDSEGRENLPAVLRCVKAFLKSVESQRVDRLQKIVFLTVQGEGPMLAYNQLQQENVKIIAVTFPIGSREHLPDGKVYKPEISERVRDFFNGVKIPIVTSRLPFEEILGAEAHNREMKVLRDAIGLFGSSMALAVQAVLQATDAGYVDIGEQVIAITGDTAILATATTTRNLLRQDHRGFAVNELICKPRGFTMSRRAPDQPRPLTLEGDSKDNAKSTVSMELIEGPK